MNWLDRLRTQAAELISVKAALPPSPPIVLMGAQGVVESPYGAQGQWVNWPDQEPFAVPLGDFAFTSSSLVMSAVYWLGRQMKSPPPKLEHREGDEYENVPDAEVLDLLARPNKNFAGETLLNAFCYDWITQGNVYWHKVRARGTSGPVVELWPLPAHRVTVQSEGTDFITYYEFSSERSGLFRYPASEIVHFRHGVDPDDPRLGLAPVRSCLNELWADLEASRYSRYMLQNRGGVPFAVCPESSAAPNSIDAAKLKAEIVAAFAGPGAYQPLVISRPVRFHDFHYGPDELNVAGTHETAEARFCAVIGISPMVLGLEVGLKHSTYSNMESAERAAWTDLVAPTLDYMAGEIREQLLPDFYPDYEDYWMTWDYTQVKALKEDQTALWNRITLGYNGGWLQRSEARAQAGYQSEPEDEQYKPAPAAPMQFADYEGGEQKRIDLWDDQAIARYFRELAPEKYDGLIIAGAEKGANNGRNGQTLTPAPSTGAGQAAA